ncbi:hypothetical protein EDD15DRAFT_283875 [Pisolithus albus]|nr:hypothetical protein EDD15DRAFT_283875 [Pisolithus albus]
MTANHSLNCIGLSTANCQTYRSTWRMWTTDDTQSPVPTDPSDDIPFPSSSSVLSLTSELHPVAQEAMEFQVRRRRAAKLTSFFGVDYRDLIDDILESIERGVEEERGRGTLQPEEVEVLLYRVWSLKSTQGQYS